MSVKVVILICILSVCLCVTALVCLFVPHCALCPPTTPVTTSQYVVWCSLSNIRLHPSVTCSMAEITRIIVGPGGLFLASVEGWRALWAQRLFWWTDERMDGRIDGQTDGHTWLWLWLWLLSSAQNYGLSVTFIILWAQYPPSVNEKKNEKMSNVQNSNKKNQNKIIKLQTPKISNFNKAKKIQNHDKT